MSKLFVKSPDFDNNNQEIPVQCKKVIIDTDCGGDDAAALLLAIEIAKK
jgi:hypothetical protein